MKQDNSTNLQCINNRRNLIKKTIFTLFPKKFRKKLKKFFQKIFIFILDNYLWHQANV